MSAGEDWFPQGDDPVEMIHYHCAAQCGRFIGWVAKPDHSSRGSVIICTHCLNNPDEVGRRFSAMGAPDE